MSENNGGPAFPSIEVYTDRNGEVCSNTVDGMTLRDYFAAKAIAGETPYNLHEHDQRAEWAYKMADAMLKAREAK